MKTKAFNKTLALNKKTIANLPGKEMDTVKAGQETGNPYICETHLRCPSPVSITDCYSDLC